MAGLLNFPKTYRTRALSFQDFPKSHYMRV